MVVRRAVVRGDGHQVRRLLDRRLPLREPDVGPADHAHLAVGPRLCRRPLHRVVAVGRLLPHGVELALRAVAAPGVLVEGRVAALGEVAPGAGIAVAAGVGRAPVVGRPLQDHGERPVTRRQVHLGREPDAVAHRRPLDGTTHAAGIAVLPPTRPRPGRTRQHEYQTRRRGENHATGRALLRHRPLPSRDEVRQHSTRRRRSPRGLPRSAGAAEASGYTNRTVIFPEASFPTSPSPASRRPPRPSIGRCSASPCSACSA